MLGKRLETATGRQQWAKEASWQWTGAVRAGPRLRDALRTVRGLRSLWQSASSKIQSHFQEVEIEGANPRIEQSCRKGSPESLAAPELPCMGWVREVTLNGWAGCVEISAQPVPRRLSLGLYPTLLEGHGKHTFLVIGHVFRVKIPSQE